MGKAKISKTVKAVKEVKEDSYNFFTGLCASRKMLVTGKIENPVSGTIKVFNAYKASEHKFNNCKGKHYEIFQTLKGKTVKCFGLECTFKQGKDVTDRVMVFNKIPRGLDVKI